MQSSIPKLTIGLPTFKRPHELSCAIQQILDQTFLDFELIIVDDASNDDTSKVVNGFKDKRIYFLKNEENLGVASSLNKIISLARGKYFIYLSDHDYYDKNLLLKCVFALDSNQASNLVMPGLFRFNQRKDKIRFDQLDWPSINNGNKKLKEYLMQKNSFSSPFHASCMYKVSKLKEIGFFYDINYSYFSDIDLNIRALVDSEFIYLEEMLIGVTVRESSHELNFKEVESLKILHAINFKFLNSLKIQNINSTKFLDTKINMHLNLCLCNSTFRGLNNFKKTEKKININFPDSNNKFNRGPAVLKFCLYFIQFLVRKFIKNV
ncbi:glycosyltransferase [Gammaproteobacteria bacterium]|nr:glycosyltransferase [Gammaproteobacteria bacterium]